MFQEMSFKDLSIFSSDSYFVQWSGTICAILVEGIMGTIHVKSFKLGPGVTLANSKDPDEKSQNVGLHCQQNISHVRTPPREGERKEEWDRLRGPNTNPNLPHATCQQAKK